MVPVTAVVIVGPVVVDTTEMTAEVVEVAEASTATNAEEVDTLAVALMRMTAAETEAVVMEAASLMSGTEMEEGGEGP